MPITRTITIEKKKTRRTRQVAFKRKPNPKGKHLVVVESPAKAKTIERILGPTTKSWRPWDTCVIFPSVPWGSI